MTFSIDDRVVLTEDYTTDAGKVLIPAETRGTVTYVVEDDPEKLFVKFDEVDNFTLPLHMLLTIALSPGLGDWALDWPVLEGQVIDEAHYHNG